jgi:hypothetical protein
MLYVRTPEFSKIRSYTMAISIPLIATERYGISIFQEFKQTFSLLFCPKEMPYHCHPCQFNVLIVRMYKGTASACKMYRNEYRHWWLLPVILAAWAVEIRRIMIQGQPGQKLHKIPSQPIAVCGSTCLLSHTSRRSRSEGSWFQAILGKKIFKIVSQQKDGCSGEHLSFQQQHEA